MVGSFILCHILVFFILICHMTYIHMSCDSPSDHPSVEYIERTIFFFFYKMLSKCFTVETMFWQFYSILGISDFFMLPNKINVPI